MRNLFKERRIKILIISLMLSLGVLFGSKPFISFKKDIQLKMVLKTEKGFDFQVFYTQDPNKHFNEQESFRQKIAGENSFQNIVVYCK